MNVEHASDAVCEAWSLATASGLSFFVPPSMRSLSTYVLLEQERWFEPEMTLLPRLLQPGMNTLDIGANHGVYALEMARCTQTGRVWAFEPTQAPRSNLQRSVQANGLGDRITVVAAGLAECAGTASFAISDNSELNSRSGSGERRETVRLEALDDYLEKHAPGVRFDFVKLDAEGGELQVLSGARRFFEAQSPVVLFELKHGMVMNTSLLERWRALGFELFRWSAELNLLLPFDAAADETDFALNLVAVRPAQQQALAQRGLLVMSTELQTVSEPTPDPRALGAWCTLSGQSLSDIRMPVSAADTAYLRAMNAVASAHLQPGLSPAERVALMVSARVTLLPFLDGPQGAGPEAWALLVHSLYALGQQNAAVQMAAQMLARWPQTQPLTLPFVPPQVADLDRVRTTAPGSWLRQVLSEFVAMKSAHSSYFAPPCPERWAQLMAHPDHCAEIERRYMLSHMVQDRVAVVDKLQRLPSPEHTCNASLWHALLQATRVMVREDSSAPSTAPRFNAAEQVLAGLPAGQLQIVDVGASSLGPETEPYAELVKHGRARVIGFEPDPQALAQLRERHPNIETHRFLPHIVGNGQPGVFHETEWSLTASLLEPDREMLDRYHQLGEAVRERARHAVQTVRLDDLIGPGGLDVLKVDVQGAEAQVFEGAVRRLDECLVVWTEVEFVALYRNQPLFADIDIQLRRHGLQFLCFAGAAQRTLASWPRGIAPTPQRQQLLWADAVYVPSPERIAALDAAAAARLALLAHHMLGAPDLCHAALMRHDRVVGSDFALRYLAAATAA